MEQGRWSASAEWARRVSPLVLPRDVAPSLQVVSLVSLNPLIIYPLLLRRRRRLLLLLLLLWLTLP